jgi:hypothetical protein
MPEASLSPDRIARQRERMIGARAYWASKSQADWPRWVYDVMGVATATPDRNHPKRHSKPYRLSWSDCSL